MKDIEAKKLVISINISLYCRLYFNNQLEDASIWLLNDPHPFKILIRQLLSGHKMTFNVIMIGLSKSSHQ